MRAAALLLTLSFVASPPVQAGDPSIPSLCAQLAGPDGNARRQAAQGLGDFKDPTAVGPLLDAYRSEAGDAHGVKAACAESLGRIGTSQAGTALGAMLDDEDYWVRKKAAEALSGIPGDIAENALRKALKDEDPRVRAAAVVSLGTVKGPVEPMLAVLEDPDARVRAAALEALTLAESPQATAIVSKAMEGPDPVVRYRAASLAARRGNPRGLDVLARGLRSEAAGHALREASLAGCAAVSVLSACASADDCLERERAFGALERQDCQAATDALFFLAMSRQETAARRVRAASALFERGAKLSGQQLAGFTAVLGESDPDLIAVALQILLEQGGPETLGATTPHLAHENKVVRHFAIANVAKFGSPLQERLLVDALADPNGANVRMALEGLGRLGTRASVPAVRSLLDDGTFRRYAQATLEAIESRH